MLAQVEHQTYFDHDPVEHSNPTGSTTLLHTTLCADELGVATSTPTSAMPGHGAAPLHWNAATESIARVPRMGPQTTSEIWNVDVSHSPVAPL